MVPVWAYDADGLQCPLRLLGWRMGHLAMQTLEVGREKDPRLLVFPEIGVGHPYSCLVDGIQAVTGCAYGKLRPEQTRLGKLALTLVKPGEGAVRVTMKPGLLERLVRFEFFGQREAGQEASEIPEAAIAEVVEWLLGQPDEALFAAEAKPDFTFRRVPSSLRRGICVKCKEDVFEDSICFEGGRPLCYVCAGYEY